MLWVLCARFLFTLFSAVQDSVLWIYLAGSENIYHVSIMANSIENRMVTDLKSDNNAWCLVVLLLNWAELTKVLNMNTELPNLAALLFWLWVLTCYTRCAHVLMPNCRTLTKKLLGAWCWRCLAQPRSLLARSLAVRKSKRESNRQQEKKNSFPLLCGVWLSPRSLFYYCFPFGLFRAPLFRF